MSRISFLVGFDRTAGQSSPADIAAAVETDNTTEVKSRRALRRKGEEDLEHFWEETRIGLVNRMRWGIVDSCICQLTALFCEVLNRTTARTGKMVGISSTTGTSGICEMTVAAHHAYKYTE